ncbi:MAG: hypothetical protein GY710_05980 [Desulfobacteraceae bacterium]|nr:hypothetical protein [Desulfobacteraceae bacterium]
MSGNVYEWVEDLYYDNYVGTPVDQEEQWPENNNTQ